MAKPLVDLPDAERKAIDVLLAAGHSVVSTNFPSETLSESDEVIQVDLEGSDSSDYPIVERAQVRIVGHCGPGRRTAVKALVAEAIADLYTLEGDADVAGVVILTGRSSIVTDPTTGNVMCWALVRLDLKASLAS